MPGLHMKSFLLKVTGERSNLGQGAGTRLSGALSFVITHLREVVAGVCVHLIVGLLSVCGLTPVGNRLSRLILPLPAPLDGVSGA